MFFFLFMVLALVLPVPAISFSNSTCTPETIQTRIEWANMANDDKQSYLKAVKCLMQLPAQTGINGTVTRFDDMNAMHQVQAKTIHLVVSIP
jgi:tyrosinase